ncbi:MAG: enoyl-CoA hydratase [Betaproteobacteria bacterium]|nr:enoyl-CoA hydratase [Betaproteobacteria bacterium]
MTQHIRTETFNRVRRILIDRPDKKNALTVGMYQSMADALVEADADPGVRVVLVHGRPDCFCAGNDLDDFLNNPPQDDDAPVVRFLNAISGAVKPIVAATGGPAVGIGTTMLLHCDLVYAAPDTKLQLPFTLLGLVPEAASSYLLPALAGYQRAAELLLLGKPFTAAKALEAGIVTEVIPEADVIDYAVEAATTLAALPAASVQMTKALMKKHARPLVAEQMHEELALFRTRLASPEAREAFSAFLEKRPPDFSKF